MPKTRTRQPEDDFPFKQRPNAEAFRRYGLNPLAMEAMARFQRQQNLYPENLDRAKAHCEDWAYELEERLTHLVGNSLQAQELCETATALSKSEAEIEQYQKLASRLESLEKREKETFFRLTQSGLKKLLPWLAVATLLLSFVVYVQLTNGSRNSSTLPSTDLPQTEPTRPTGASNRAETPKTPPAHSGESEQG